MIIMGYIIIIIYGIVPIEQAEGHGGNELNREPILIWVYIRQRNRKSVAASCVL